MKISFYVRFDNRNCHNKHLGLYNTDLRNSFDNLASLNTCMFIKQFSYFFFLHSTSLQPTCIPQPTLAYNFSECVLYEKLIALIIVITIIAAVKVRSRSCIILYSQLQFRKKIIPPTARKICTTCCVTTARSALYVSESVRDGKILPRATNELYNNVALSQNPRFCSHQTYYNRRANQSRDSSIKYVLR